MSTPRSLNSYSSPSPKGTYTDDVQISSACEGLRLALDNLSEHIQVNLVLRVVNAKLDGETVSAPPASSNTNDGEAARTEAIELLSEINDVTSNDGDEKGLKSEFLEKLKKSFEKVGRLATGLIAENEDLREIKNYLCPNVVEQSEQAMEQFKNRKEEEGEERYQGGSYDDDDDDDDTCSSPEEESAETYTDLCSLQVRASDKLVCLLEDLDSQIQESQKLRKVNAKLTEEPSPSPPYDKNKEAEAAAEAAAEEARQLLLESKSRVYRNDEQQDLNKLVQKFKKKSNEIGSLMAKVIRKSKVLKETNELLKIYGVPKYERQSDIKEVVTASKSAPRDQDRNDDDLRETNRFLQAKLQAMEAAMRDATAGSSARLMTANERIYVLEKQLAGAIAKATEASVSKSHASPGPKPEENVGSSSPTSGAAARLPLVSKATVDPEATDIPPPLDTLSPAELFIRRAKLPSDSQEVKQQAKLIDSSKPPKHPSSGPSSSPTNSETPPSFAAKPLNFLRSAADWLRWPIWFFVLFMMLAGVFLCWIEWAGLHRERSMWLGANEISRMEVEGEIAKAWRGRDRVGIVSCLDRGL